MHSCLLVSRLVYPLVSANRIFRSRPRPLPLPLPGGRFHTLLVALVLSWSLLRVSRPCVAASPIVILNQRLPMLQRSDCFWKNRMTGKSSPFAYFFTPTHVQDAFGLLILIDSHRSNRQNRCRAVMKMRIRQNCKNRKLIGFP